MLIAENGNVLYLKNIKLFLFDMGKKKLNPSVLELCACHCKCGRDVLFKLNFQSPKSYNFFLLDGLSLVDVSQLIRRVKVLARRCTKVEITVLHVNLL